jgi:hypothetical protein
MRNFIGNKELKLKMRQENHTNIRNRICPEEERIAQISFIRMRNFSTVFSRE